MQLWASPEPTIARIGPDAWRDQLEETGHARRFADLDLLAGLGVAAARYPVLWEREDLDWARPRLEYLRAAGVEPIVTLLHHGSGPTHTSLVDERFPELFAAYASGVARAFPWVRTWTPINEPLTTARFSTLYGHWYPNARDDAAFGLAIANQARAIQLATQRIRAENPAARMVITEDLQGFTAGDRAEEPYVAFLRERAYLSIELVAGRVDRNHPLWKYLTVRARLAPRTLDELVAHAVVPDVVGWNWYPHSERFLFRYEGMTADVPALYVEGCTISPRPLLRAAHARLGLPQAISEVHVHANEEERARWLMLRYEDACELEREGVPIEAVGAWAAFGSIDWHSLLRERAGIAEDGIFTFARAGESPRETAVSRTLRRLASGRTPPVASAAGATQGWWERPERFRPREELAARARAGIPDGWIPVEIAR